MTINTCTSHVSCQLWLHAWASWLDNWPVSCPLFHASAGLSISTAVKIHSSLMLQTCYPASSALFTRVQWSAAVTVCTYVYLRRFRWAHSSECKATGPPSCLLCVRTLLRPSMSLCLKCCNVLATSCANMSGYGVHENGVSQDAGVARAMCEDAALLASTHLINSSRWNKHMGPQVCLCRISKVRVCQNFMFV